MLKVEAAGESCLCDFTYDFFWQHRGSRLNPDQTVSKVSFRQMVEALRRGEVVKIKGNVGSRLASSLGVDLVRLGGKGGPIEATGKLIVDGNVGHRMGISMLRGAIYVSGRVEPPLGNVVEVESDLSGYRKFISLTEVLERRLPVHEPNHQSNNELVICDGILRDTLGARNPVDKAISLQGDAGMSTGILMQRGLIDVSGDAGRNTGVLLQGGRILIKGSTEDFTGAEMRGGEIIVAKDAGNFACAKMRGGAVYAREGKPLPPAQARMLGPSDQAVVARLLGISPIYAMMYRKLSL